MNSSYKFFNVFDEFCGVKGHLTYGSVDNAITIYFKVDFTGFNFAYSLTNFHGTVPLLGLGIKPRGPNTLPKAPTLPITLGMVMITSTSVQPSLIFAM